MSTNCVKMMEPEFFMGFTGKPAPPAHYQSVSFCFFKKTSGRAPRTRCLYLDILLGDNFLPAVKMGDWLPRVGLSAP